MASDRPEEAKGRAAARQGITPLATCRRRVAGGAEQVDVAARLDAVRDGLSAESQRFLALTQIDTLWKAHMKAMGYVKDFAGLKVYAQEDPLDVYRSEGIKLFDAMQTAYAVNTVFSFFMYEPQAKT